MVWMCIYIFFVCQPIFQPSGYFLLAHRMFVFQCPCFSSATSAWNSALLFARRCCLLNQKWQQTTHRCDGGVQSSSNTHFSLSCLNFVVTWWHILAERSNHSDVFAPCSSSHMCYRIKCPRKFKHSILLVKTHFGKIIDGTHLRAYCL